jgi:hypothetical protein
MCILVHVPRPFTLVLALLALALGAVHGQSPARQDAALTAFLGRAESPPVSYRAVRRLTASTRGGRMTAVIVARTTLTPEEGFTYVIEEESGSGVIRDRVLRAALEAERVAVRNGEGGPGALTPINYEFGEGGLDRSGLVRVPIRPRTNGPFLVDGQMWLSDAGDLLQVDGRLVKRPSFWTRQVQVVRRWARIAGVRVPVAMESTAQVLVTGASTFAMTYEYEAINGVIVTPQP